MKKVLSLVLTVILTVSAASTVLAAKFPDVDDNYSWAEEAISALSANKVITGYEDGTFKPGKSITKQEAITLFSKALGASETANEAIVNLAYDLYGADLTGCDGSYALKQGAYMIYRKVLSANEVISYLSSSNRNKELKRYEAATLIAKALGADAWLKQNPEFDLSFDDKNSIPTDAEGYVYYATELGIMNGMGDNKFGANETVTRAQIAVMIKRILDTMEFEYVRGMISTVDAIMGNISLKTDDGALVQFNVENTGAIFLDGTKVTVNKLGVGMECVATFSKEALYQIDALTYKSDDVVTGAYRGKTTTNDGTTIKVLDIKDADRAILSYKLSDNVVVEVDGEAGSLAAIESNDYVELKISGGLVVSLSAEDKTQTISSVEISDIETGADGVIITMLTNDDEIIQYPLADIATITRNSKKAEFSDLAIGDTAKITMEYREITNIMAVGKEQTLEGYIEEFTISNATSYITISDNGTKSKYIMAKDCAVTLEGKSASIYDLRLGAYVKLKASSDMITAIESKAVAQALTVTGTIKTINNSYGLVVISYVGAGGETVDKQLFLGSNAKILDSKTGKLLTLRNLSVGNVITAAGTEKLGVYEVSSLMILQ